MLFKTHGKRVGVIVSIIALILIVGYVVYRVKKEKFLNHELQTTVKDKTKGLYTISYDSISVNEMAGDLYIKNIYIKGDTSRQMEMINKKDTNATSTILEIYIPMLKVVAFKTAKALLSKRLECRQIIISSPTVQMYVFPGQGREKDNKRQQEELYRQLLGKFKLIKADSVSVLDAQMVASDFSTKEVKFKTFNTTINLNQLAIDSTYNQDTTRTLFCKEISVNAGRVVLGDKNNTAQIRDLTFNTRLNLVKLSSLSYDAFKNKGFFKTKIEDISLEGVELHGPVENSDLTINRVIIDKGDLETMSGDEKATKNKPQRDKKILTGWMKKIAVNTLHIKSVNYVHRNTDPKLEPFLVANNSFSIHHLEINRSASLNEKLINTAREIQLANEDISIKSGDKLYEYKISGIKLNTKTKTISIKSVQVIPQLGEEAFAKKAVYQTDRYNVAFNNIRCTNVDPEKLIKGQLDIGNITSNRSSVKVFRDLSYPIDSISRRGKQMTYPHQLIHKIGIPINIEKCTFADTYIEYKEKNAMSKNSGRVRFANTNLILSNISTDKAKRGDKTTVRFKTAFLDSIPVTGGFTFSLNEWQKGVFTTSASVTNPISAPVLNQLTEPMGLVKVEKGLIKSINFYMKADTNTSNGTLVIPYEDLKLSVLKKKGDTYKKKAIISLLANVAVKNNNKEGEGMRTANVVITRNKYRSFFNFIWMTIFKGLKEVAVLKL